MAWLNRCEVLLASLGVLGQTELHISSTATTRRIHQDISYRGGDEVNLLALANIRNFLFLNEEEMLQEEGHNSRKYSTGAALVLENTVLHLVIEVEALAP